jgi:hypothetical protein
MMARELIHWNDTDMTQLLFSKDCMVLYYLASTGAYAHPDVHMRHQLDA